MVDAYTIHQQLHYIAHEFAPWSETISIGMPNLVQMQLNMKLATAFPAATGRGEASAHLVTYWVATKMYFFQIIIGRDPTKGVVQDANPSYQRIGRTHMFYNAM